MVDLLDLPRALHDPLFQLIPGSAHLRSNIRQFPVLFSQIPDDETVQDGKQEDGKDYGIGDSLKCCCMYVGMIDTDDAG